MKGAKQSFNKLLEMSSLKDSNKSIKEDDSVANFASSFKSNYKEEIKELEHDNNDLNDRDD